MSFKPHYSEIKRGKDYLYLVHYSKHSTVRLHLVYNEISSTYMGVKLDGFVENIRGLLYTYSNFLEVVGVDPNKELAKLGFSKTAPSALELLLYKK
ncbi:hypothetical protein [Aurantibacillus circumpalustris]|uniref:hypothetical protein n=1 Tax=Aurantibacillus circumpalustris TaxID=3036359 RepID=UPI00295ABF76|nr:hypothetical protein [Aurantibacillus circumpalustris]